MMKISRHIPHGWAGLAAGALTGIGFTAALFGGIFAILVVATSVQLRATEPLESEAIEAAILRLLDNPDSQEIRDEVRALDYLARNAYLSGLSQIRSGVRIVVFSALTAVLCFGGASLLRGTMPIIDTSWKRDGSSAPAQSSSREETEYRAGRTVRAFFWIGGFLLYAAAVVAPLVLNGSDNLAGMDEAVEVAESGAMSEPEFNTGDEVTTGIAEIDPSGISTSQSSISGSQTSTSSSQTADSVTTDPTVAAYIRRVESGEITIPSATELAENWPVFRGGRAMAGGDVGGLINHDTTPPMEWDGVTGRNVRWRAEVPKPGYGSPVVWANSVFLTGGDEEEFSVVCYSTLSGEIRWERDIEDVTGSEYALPEVSEDTGYAAASPAVDGRHVYAIFATGELVAFDLDGNLIWSRFMGTPENIYGHSSSLTLFQGLVFVQYDHDAEASVTALDGSNGEVVWHRERDVYTSWASPLVIDDGRRRALILNANPYVTAYDPLTGEELWSVDCMGGEVAPSPAYDDGIVYVANQFAVLAAIHLGSGDLLWEGWDDLPEVASPLAHAGYIVLAAGYGGVTCYSAETEEPVWHVEYENGIYSSPILLDGMVYLTDNSGKTHIFEAGPAYEEIGIGMVGETVVSTPAYSAGQLFIRGIENLYCIEGSNE